MAGTAPGTWSQQDLGRGFGSPVLKPGSASRDVMGVSQAGNQVMVRSSICTTRAALRAGYNLGLNHLYRQPLTAGASTKEQEAFLCPLLGQRMQGGGSGEASVCHQGRQTKPVAGSETQMNFEKAPSLQMQAKGRFIQNHYYHHGSRATGLSLKHSVKKNSKFKKRKYY